MKTQNINTSEQMDALNFPYGSQERKEVTLKSMIISCFTYGSADVDSFNYNKYIVPHRERLGEELFNEVYNEQMKFLKGCTINHGVYTDGKGCTYNSLVPPEDSI